MKNQKQIIIKQGYTPGIIGRVVEMHASYYKQLVGFGIIFESKVAGGLSEFIPRAGNTGNAIWYAEKDGEIVGSITIDGEGMGNGIAHLRWFIVSDSVRGSGTGGKLMRLAMAFCDAQEFSETHLWTFRGLEAARKLYERNGALSLPKRAKPPAGKPPFQSKNSSALNPLKGTLVNSCLWSVGRGQ